MSITGLIQRKPKREIKSRYDIVFCLARNFCLKQKYDGWSNSYSTQNMHVQFEGDKLLSFSIDMFEGELRFTRWVNKKITEVTNRDLQP